VIRASQRSLPILDVPFVILNIHGDRHMRIDELKVRYGAFYSDGLGRIEVRGAVVGERQSGAQQKENNQSNRNYSYVFHLKPPSFGSTNFAGLEALTT
jgi:hypothetical protein